MLRTTRHQFRNYLSGRVQSEIIQSALQKTFLKNCKRLMLFFCALGSLLAVLFFAKIWHEGSSTPAIVLGAVSVVLLLAALGLQFFLRKKVQELTLQASRGWIESSMNDTRLQAEFGRSQIHLGDFNVDRIQALTTWIRGLDPGPVKKGASRALAASVDDFFEVVDEAFESIEELRHKRFRRLPYDEVDARFF